MELKYAKIGVEFSTSISWKLKQDTRQIVHLQCLTLYNVI